MPVRKRGDVWYVRLQIGGQRIERAAGKGASKQDAVALEAKIRRDHLSGKLGVAPKRTVSDALARWIEHDTLTLKSRDNLLGKVALILPHCGGRPLSQILEVVEAVKREGLKGKLQPATINRRLAILRRVANLAYEQWGWLDEPIGKRIKLLPGESARHTYLTPSEAQQLIDACDHPRVTDAILIALTTGLRESEILGLTEAHRRDGLIILDANTKSGRPRAVPDPGVALPLGITYATLRTFFERSRVKAGLPHVRFHDLRHTTASWLLQRGESMLLVRDLLGHSSLAVTSRYAHLAPQGLHKAGKLLRKVAPFLPSSAGENGANGAETDAPTKRTKRAKSQ